MTVATEPRWRDVGGRELGRRIALGIVYTGDDFRSAVPIPRDWGPWQLDVEVCVLRAGGYEVDLERFRTRGDVLDMIAHISGKGWADPATLSGLVVALLSFVDPWHDRQPSAAHIRQRARAVAAERAQGFAVYGVPA